MFKSNLAIVDIETTGIHGIRDRIIEIAVLRVENNKIVEKLTTLINPQAYVSPYIERLTGISREELYDAPLFSDVKDKILALLNDAVFVAHNARFDYGFITSELKRLDVSFHAKTLCTVKLSRRLFPRYKRHSLEAIIQRFDLTYKKRHRAYDDAYILWQFLQKLKRTFTKDKLQDIWHMLLKSSYSGNEYIRRQIEALPETAGVYLFYDEKNMPLYVGKSKNIRTRVISHFSSDYQSAHELELTKSISRIECKKTAGELGALVEESTLIKSLLPVFNRKLRKRKSLYILEKTIDDKGYFTFVLKMVDSLESINFDEILGIFKSKKSAKDKLVFYTKKYGLCEKLMGLEKTKSSCFGYKMGKCKGACVGEEKKALYNGRFIIAFAENKEFRSWPYSGPIEIIEKNEETNLYESFIINDWIIVSRKNGLVEEMIQSSSGFDVDTYKILSSYIRYKNPILKVLKNR